MSANLSLADIRGILELSKTDLGMQDLLMRVKEYYILHGSPPGPRVPGEYVESEEEKHHRLMNTRYGI